MHTATQRGTILIGEDDREIRNYLEITLRCQGYEVASAADGDEVLSCLRDGDPVSAVLLDIVMPCKDGLETLREIRQTNLDLPVIMVSGMASPLHVVEAMKSGATDFLSKPVSHEAVGKAIQKALAGSNKPEQLPSLPADVLAGEDMFFGSNPLMEEVRSLVYKMSGSDVPILIQGETGTGKEVLARRVHAASKRSGKPFVKLNCAAVPADLMESELFGYERGAFTGAFQRKPGLFEMAQGGTILLDEIGDLDLKLQAKLLQVLQDHEFRRLGGKDVIRVDVRVLAATHRDLDTAIANNTFREDLYYRLNVVTVWLPALRERPEDICPLAAFLTRRHSTPEFPPVELCPELKRALMEYSWPGNVRELENVVRKLMVFRDPDIIINDLRHKSFRRASGQERFAYPERPAAMAPKPVRTESHGTLEDVSRAMEQAEAHAILTTLNSTRWNRKQAAALLNIDYKALLYKMKKLSIEQRALSTGT